MPTPEQERLRRLRDRQLATRDPLIKQRRLDRTISQRHRSARQPLSLRRIWAEIPHWARGTMYGMLGGALVTAVLPLLWPSTWSVVIGLASVAVLAIVGFFFGRAADTRDEIKDLMR